ncbi:Di-copper centre-containing protein [Rhizodiscina lignyota]|uniref:Di-copper centre-containing protein n=1 Tax=Rhizodiscina lignyota TaxID=1504668 RepID=A0A9P4M4U2_9PEZI|nr:Di-copper centre-containing protein [Rhizodiscina lignyota]
MASQTAPILFQWAIRLWLDANLFRSSIKETDRARYISAGEYLDLDSLLLITFAEILVIVQCLYDVKRSPAKSNPSDVPGALNRLDDFVAVHIQQSDYIHFNGNLYAWHRYLTHLYSKALKDECGYKGPIPYWDWVPHCRDQRKSPVFDGGRYSMGSNGRYEPHGNTTLTAFGLHLELTPGTGGGCVYKGPFQDLTVHLGLSPTIAPANRVVLAALPLENAGPTANTSAPSALDYNPRCLTRDINPSWSQQSCLNNVVYLLQCPDVVCLEKRADGWETIPQQTQQQVHSAGHFSIGGLQNDPFASPGDPVFYLHHAQLDRIWAIWQGQDFENRKLALGGTTVPFTDSPNAPLVTLQDPLSFGTVGPTITHEQAMSTIDYDMCYIYD